jgi:hypothetical protein
MGVWDDTRSYILENKLKSIGILWASGLGASLAYQWSRPIPNSLKVIHSRVYAQALTLGSLAAVAVIEHMDHKSETSQEFVKANSRLAELERRYGFGEHGNEEPHSAK